MKLNSKLKSGRKRETSFRKSKNKEKHVKIVAEPTKREKQILNGEKPDDYVNAKPSPMALIMRMSRHRQDKLARINEEYNRQMNLENEAKLKKLKENNKDTDIDKDKDDEIEKINKEDNIKQESQPQKEKEYKMNLKDNEIKKEKKFEKNKNEKDEEEEEKEKENVNKNVNEKDNEKEDENPLMTKIENDNTRNNFKFRNRYFQRTKTEENKDLGNSKKIYQKREIKFRKPLFLEEKLNMDNSINANKNMGNDKQILTDRPGGYGENKIDDKINDSINKRFFKLNKTRYFNRDENHKKNDIRNKIERINSYSNKVNSSFNKTNIKEENNNELKNVYYNNYNTEDQTKKNDKVIISYKGQIQELKNSRSNNDVFSNNTNNNKEGEIKKTDTKVYVSQRPAIINDKEKILNTIDTILEKDNNSPRKIKTRNVIRNNIYKREINDNIINKTEKEMQEENNDNKNKGSFNSRRRRYDLYNKAETVYIEKDNKENNDILDKFEYRGTRNKKNSIINNNKTSYDNVKVDRKEKADLSVDNAPKISEANENQDNSATNSYRRRYQSITRGNKEKNEQNKIKNNDTSVDSIVPKWKRKKVINTENQDKDKDNKPPIPFRRKFVNVTRSFDPVIKRSNKKENDDEKNEKNYNEEHPEERGKVGRRYENTIINNYTKVDRDNQSKDVSKDKLDNKEVKGDEEKIEEDEGEERNRKRKRFRYQRYYNNINWKVDDNKELNKSSDKTTQRRRSNI